MRRASQTLSTQDASRLVSEAARRASEKAPSKRTRGRRRYFDVVAIGVAAVVAGTALKHRRNHEESISLLEAELARAKADTESAHVAVDRMRSSLLEGASDAVRAIDGRPSDQRDHAEERANALKEWMEQHIDSVLKQSDSAGEVVDNRKPKMI